jgi:aspartate racemase
MTTSAPDFCIGIVGGMGPMAGLRLAQQITSIAAAEEDQRHPRIILISQPDRIPDRTAYLLTGAGENPAVGILTCIDMLCREGATILGVPCNTAHAAPIWGGIVAAMEARERRPRLVNMIDSVVTEVAAVAKMGARIGVLATQGTVHSQTFDMALAEVGMQVIYPRVDQQSRLHEAIYDRRSGIKATGHPTQLARTAVFEVMKEMAYQGVDAFILGCTELPLAVEQTELDGIPLFDPSAALARALLSEWVNVPKGT